MFNLIDKFLDTITMYRLVLYELIFLICLAVIFSFFNLLPYSAFAIIVTTLFLLFVCYIANKIFAYAFNAPTNVESLYITALILALIAKPIHSIHDLGFIGWLAVWSMSSKYILALKNKHIFNPVAIAGIVCSIGLAQNLNWWVGTGIMAPFVLLTGLLTIKKIQRGNLVFSFFATTILLTGVSIILKNGNIFSGMQSLLVNSSMLFFGFVMLTEPLTTPPTKNLQILYGIFVGILFTPYIHFGPLFFTPELALVVGNIFSYLISPKEKFLLKLKEKIQIGQTQMDFIFSLPSKFNFTPGQYMEWTLSHKNTDSRGNRRYFSLASSPTESDLRMGVKFYPNGSSYKKALVVLSSKDTIVASQLAGDFVLPKDKNKKLVFMAGGIGITPFRSMIKFLLDTKEKRDIILFYSNKIESEIMYKDVFDAASQNGYKIIYTLTDAVQVQSNWEGYKGRVNPEIIKKEIPDFKERTFYLSGPHSMVVGFEQVLKQMGVSASQIKKDFFPGLV